MTPPDTKPEALRLADALDARVVTRWVHATGTTPRSSGHSPDTQCRAAADRLRRLHAECESLRTKLAAEKASRQAAQIRCEELTAEVVRLEPMRQRASDLEALRTQLAEANQPSTDDIEYAKAQGWDVDGATAWHLIWRHADGWAGTRLMMEAWRDAAVAKAVAERDAARAEADALRADARRLDWMEDHTFHITDDCRMLKTWGIDHSTGRARGDTIREAIDTAMGAMKEGE